MGGPGPTALNMMRLVNAVEGSGVGSAAAAKAGHDFVVEVSPDSIAFLRSFGEMALNVVSVFGGEANWGGAGLGGGVGGGGDLPQ